MNNKPVLIRIRASSGNEADLRHDASGPLGIALFAAWDREPSAEDMAECDRVIERLMEGSVTSLRSEDAAERKAIANSFCFGARGQA